MYAKVMNYIIFMTVSHVTGMLLHLKKQAQPSFILCVLAKKLAQ